MRHHAYTNDPSRDPDHFSDGSKRELLVKMLGITMVNMFLPFFALVPKTRVVLPKSMLGIFDIAGGSKKEGLAQVRFWLITHVVLIGSMFFGLGWQALALWYIPARLQFAYLIFVFAWYPHHPAGETTRYRHTRIAVFRGSGLIIRGHDHHAMHHMFPRVPHYRLRALWNDVAQDMVAKGVRAEGRATAATTPVVW
jgi:beta-carotene hydroxylase